MVQPAHVLRRGHARRRHPPPRLGHHIIDHGPDHPPHGLQPRQPVVEIGPLSAHRPHDGPDQRNLGQLLQPEQPRLHPVVHVMVVVGDVVGQRRHLRLGRRPAIQPQRIGRVIGRDRRPGRPRQLCGHRPVVLDEPLQRLPRQVQADEIGIAVLQLGRHAEGLDVVVKAAERLHPLFQLVLARMAERRVAEVVGQGHRLGEVRVQPHGRGDGAGDLRHLQRVGQPGAVVVALVGHENLGLFLQPPERRSVDDAVAVAGEGGAAAALGLGKTPAFGARRVLGEGGARRRLERHRRVAPSTHPFPEGAGALI